MTRPGYYYDKVPTLYWLFFHTKTWWECNPPLLTYPVFALVFVFGFVWFFLFFGGGWGVYSTSGGADDTDGKGVRRQTRKHKIYERTSAITQTTECIYKVWVKYTCNKHFGTRSERPLRRVFQKRIH